jgi:lipopolysaccharide/colanic/teichoic acid biosynthesis glycosyltransferase
MGRQGSIIKRITDILFSVIILVITSPILLFCAIAIKLESEGPVFFIHEPVGYNGKNFRMIKFRGMVNNALAIGPVLTQENDPRLTKTGKFLRRTSIDEIPNFLNVLKGDMSVVGPRPEMPELTYNYTSKQKEIFLFKPGVTGYSQVNGRQKLTPGQRVDMELNYYKNAGFMSDLKIIIRTLKIVITNDGNI